VYLETTSDLKALGELPTRILIVSRIVTDGRAAVTSHSVISGRPESLLVFLHLVT
jgi:hypothetical protein